MKFLLERAQWYPRWLKFNQHFRMRKLNAVGRWATHPSEEDYLRDCPQLPDGKHIHEIGFDGEDIVAFLDRSGVPHALRAGSPEASSMPSPIGAESGALAKEIVNSIPQSSPNDDGLSTVKPTTLPARKVQTAKPGRRSLIEKALQHAYEAAGELRHDVDEVFEQLIKLAEERPEDFRPLSRYHNGEVLYWVQGKERPYKKSALKEYIKRRENDGHDC